MKFDAWLRENESVVDWSPFSSPWDAMQLKHNPFREEQIEAILRCSGALEMQSPKVLDLGCGPGTLGKLLIKQRPHAHYVGVDGDPLMLAAMAHLLHGRHVSGLQADLRESKWSHSFKDQFDSVISLTALHWLSQEHQKGIYRAALDVLKPGGMFIVGDPYQPEDPAEREKLEAIHSEKATKLTGQTWEEFWKTFFQQYRIEQMYTEYHKAQGYQIPFEGSDNGYPLSAHLRTLRDVGFRAVSVLWTADLRAVYGGKKRAT
jgi:SAM-dependent methyltransferase